MDNTLLPAEVLAEIKKGAQSTLARASSDLKYSAGYYDGYSEGATEYATKLHHAQQEIEQLLWKSRIQKGISYWPFRKGVQQLLKTFIIGSM